ncbi:MAG: HAD-IA family hydrolase, partial [Nitrospira sp.]|nr:HAD-IA family hydrolase [Nitrospira sp.]
MLKTIIFDFNGVIADDEPLHLELFQKVLGEEGLPLSEQDYYSKNYLGMDDRGCFGAVFKAQGRMATETDLQRLIARKAEYYKQAIQNQMILFPGAVNFVKQAGDRYPLAIASGALRHEIVMILDHTEIKQYFETIVSAEDVRQGKPSPEGFIKALERLNADPSRSSKPILPGECLVIEDSPFGIAAARSAGMKCLAITNSYPAERLSEAHQIVKTLEGLKLEKLESLFQQPVLAYCPDLLFTSKITDTGRHLRIKVEVANSITQLEEKASAIQPNLILIDLGSNGVDYPGSIRRLRDALPNTNLIAYGSHV